MNGPRVSLLVFCKWPQSQSVCVLFCEWPQSQPVGVLFCKWPQSQSVDVLLCCRGGAHCVRGEGQVSGIEGRAA